MTEIKNFDGDISVGRHAVVGGNAKVCGGMTVGKNLKVEGWLDAKNLKAANKGVFLNEESLKNAYQEPKDGWWALVGDTLPAALWVASDGKWRNTGGTGGDILLESEVLADIKERLARAQEGVDAATTKNAEQDKRLANAEVLNTKQNERLLNYVYPKLYQLNEGAGALPFDGMYSGSASVLSGRKTAAEEGCTYKVVFALKKFLLQEISPGGVTIGLYEEWDKIISDRDSSEHYAKRDCLYYVYTEGEGSYYYYVDADGNISEKSGTYVLRKLIDETKAKVSTNTEKLDVQERYVAALNAASSEHSQKIGAIEGRAGNIETKNAEQDKKIVSLINRLNKQEEVVVSLPFDGFTDTAADRLMPFNPKDTYSYQLLFSTASNSFVLRVVDNANQVTKYIGTYSSWNAVDGAQASSYYERRDTLYKYLDLSYGAYRYYYYGEDGSFFEAPGTKYLSRIIEKQGGKIDENTQKVEELQAQVSSIEKVEDIQWGVGRHMNVFIEKGDFHIHGERTDANDGLPILNAASGHTIDARLTVLDSSLTNGTGAKTDICVTQVLRLSNRTGGDGHVFVRTGQAVSKAELKATGSTKWSTWEKLMGIFEKNAVTNIDDLNTYTTNGMYSGLFTNAESKSLGGLQFNQGDTFLIVTVNGYAASAFGTAQLTQMLYLLPTKKDNATAKMYMRTAWWNVNANPKRWEWGNFDGLAKNSEVSGMFGIISDAFEGLDGRIDENKGKIESVEDKLNNYADTFPQNPVASSESNGLMSVTDKAKVDNYPEQFVLDLGILNSQADGEHAAARSEVAGNRNISFIRFQVRGVHDLKTTLIMQWPNGINVTAQIMCVDKQQWRRNVTGATGVVGAPTNAYTWERTAPHKIDYDEQRRMIQLKDYENKTVSQGVELPLATSSQPGLMNSTDKTKLDRLAIDTTWDEQQHMNAFTETGEYHIHGIRTRDNDGLPIINSGGGHTIDGLLTVLDSSLENGTGAKTDICVTQILRLSNRTGGDGHVFVRTGQAVSKAELKATGSTKWGTWEKLMGIFEKNAVTNIADLDTYTTNGMYSGLFADTTLQSLGGLQFTPGDTFLMVTVNGYAASTFGTPQLTQMLYRLPSKQGSIGFARMYVRTAYWDASAKSWNFQNWDKLATGNDLSPITEELQSAKTLANNNAGRISDVEGRVSGAEGRIAAIENIIPEEYGLSTIVELGSFKNFALLLSEAAKFERVSNIGISLMHGSYLNEGSLYNGAIIIQQTNADSCTSVQYIFLEGRRFTRFIRYSSTDVVEVQGVQNDGVRDIELKGGVLQLIDMWSNPIGIGATLPDDSNIYEGNATLSTVPIVMAKAQGGTVTATLMPATSARAGVMTAADKEKLDALSIGEGGGTVDNALLTEVQEKAQSALNTAIAAKTTAQGAQTTADNANTAAQEAKATADGIAAKANSASIAAAEAKQTAGAAKSAADAAQTTANSAQTAAQEAKATATSAQTTATSAQTTATSAQTTATSAQTTANSAQAAAAEALSNSENAQTAANAAQETANSAREAATAASTAAQEAKSAAETAQSTATAAQTKNSEQDARLDNIEARIDPDIAGRVWNEDNGTPKAESYYGSVKALRDLPKRLGLGRYIVKDDRTRRKLDPNDSRKYLDGSPAKLDGSEGQCMWCWNGFYANIWHEGSRLIKAVTFDNPIGGETSIWIPAGGISWLGAGVMDRTNNILCSVINDSPQFRGGGGAALNPASYAKAPAADAPQITMLGMPATNIYATNFGNYARKRGEGWEANWFVARFVVEFLFEIIMGTENSQAAFNAENDANGLYQGGFGTGVADMPDWGNYNGSYPVIPTSVGLDAGDGVCLVPYKLPQTNGVAGDTYKTLNVPVFFGLVGAGYGHLWQWVRGLIMNAGEEQSLVYVAPSMYAAYDPNIVTDKIMVAECPRASGWIMRKSYKGLCCMPTEIGGSSTLRYSDYFYESSATSKGLRVRATGGVANYGANAGASCTNANFAATGANANYSAPLCYFAEDPIIPESEKIEI